MKRNNAVRLVSTRNLSREEWLNVRGGGIGSSDAAAAVGISPYKSPLELWLEKTGRQSAPDLAAKARPRYDVIGLFLSNSIEWSIS